MKELNSPHGRILILEDGDLPAGAYTHKRPAGERYREPIRGRFWIEVSSRATAILGPHGRQLSGSKNAYRAEHPGDAVLFNACIFDARGTEIWFGDLNLRVDADTLQAVAEELGVVYVTPELPYRWTGLPKPRKRTRDTEIHRFSKHKRM